MMLALREFRRLPSVCRSIHIEHYKRNRRFPSPWDLMTGIELWQALQYGRGNRDPFYRMPQKLGPGTKECPNIVQSMYDKRLVACLCHPDATRLVFWWLHEGYPRRCNCNYWFVLERFEPPTLYEN